MREHSIHRIILFTLLLAVGLSGVAWSQFVVDHDQACESTIPFDGESSEEVESLESDSLEQLGQSAVLDFFFRGHAHSAFQVADEVGLCFPKVLIAPRAPRAPPQSC